MTQASAKTAAETKRQSSARPEVIANEDALIIDEKFYLIDDIKDVEIKHMPWQYEFGFVSSLMSIYLYNFQPDARM